MDQEKQDIWKSFSSFINVATVQNVEHDISYASIELSYIPDLIKLHKQKVHQVESYIHKVYIYGKSHMQKLYSKFSACFSVRDHHPLSSYIKIPINIRSDSKCFRYHHVLHP